MSRTTWAIYVLQSGNTWGADGTLYVPNNPEGLIFGMNATQQRVELADGSLAFIRPETLYQKQPLTFSWFEMDVTFITKIQSYIVNGTTLKIVTNVGGREYIGRFIDFKPTWVTGEVDVYDLEALFEIMDNVTFSASDGGDVSDLIALLVYNETPTPGTNGVQTVFTVANTYVSNTLQVFRNGQLMYKNVDYTESSGTTFTMTVAPEANEYLRVNYIKQA